MSGTKSTGATLQAMTPAVVSKVVPILLSLLAPPTSPCSMYGCNAVTEESSCGSYELNKVSTRCASQESPRTHLALVPVLDGQDLIPDALAHVSLATTASRCQREQHQA
jgi:hypothetical protein